MLQYGLTELLLKPSYPIETKADKPVFLYFSNRSKEKLPV